MGHSGFGIASFAIGLIIGLLEVVFVVVAGVLGSSTPDGLNEHSPIPVLLGCSICGDIFLGFIGLILGIVGLCQSQRKKVFAVLGVVVCALLLGVAFLMQIGFAWMAVSGKIAVPGPGQIVSLGNRPDGSLLVAKVAPFLTAIDRHEGAGRAEELASAAPWRHQSDGRGAKGVTKGAARMHDQSLAGSRFGTECSCAKGKCICNWPRRDSNPHGSFPPEDFKSSVSAIPPRGLQCNVGQVIDLLQ